MKVFCGIDWSERHHGLVIRAPRALARVVTSDDKQLNTNEGGDDSLLWDRLE